jgi:hypothetical protein
MGTAFCGHELWATANIAMLRAKSATDPSAVVRETLSAIVFSASTVEMYISQAALWDHVPANWREVKNFC